MRPLVLCLAFALVAAKPPRDMTLAFSDEFDGTAVDEAKWSVSHVVSPGIISIKSGKLVIGLAKGADNLWYGGRLTTRGTFGQPRGYFEASIKAGRHRGHHLGFFLDPPEKSELYAEIFVVTASGEDQVTPWVSHNDGVALRKEMPTVAPRPFKPGSVSKDFHTYGLLWKEGELVWYMDGKQVFSTKRVIARQPGHVCVYHGVSEPEIPFFDPSKLPDNVEFDWVRVWK